MTAAQQVAAAMLLDANALQAAAAEHVGGRGDRHGDAERSRAVIDHYVSESIDRTLAVKCSLQLRYYDVGPKSCTIFA